MKKISIPKAGSYNQLQIIETPTPKPRDNELHIEIRAFGVNYADIVIRWGLYESAKRFVGWPITPGFECSGIVKAVGEKTTKFKPGDEVIAVTLFNSYATDVIVSEDQVFLKPKNLSFPEAASFPAVMMTAYHALLQNVITRPGMKALIHSAAGGVGSSLVQLCRLHKIETIGVVGSSHKVAYLKELGCDHVIDKSQEDLWESLERIAPEGVDLCFDANGPSTLKESYNHLRACGKLFSYGAHSMLPKQGGRVKYLKLIKEYLKTPRFNPIDMTSENKSLITFNLSFLFDRQDLMKEGMEDLLKWISSGEVRVPRVQTYPFERIADAHRDLESGKTVGKLVITI